MRFPLLHLFNKGKHNTRPLVNYIWVSPEKTVIDFANPVCAIELGNIRSALDNANKYDGADFNIWVDKKLLDDYSLLCLECFVRDNAAHDNVTLRDLQGIFDYANDYYFELPDPKSKGYLRDQFNGRSGTRNVYSRADYARIVVLDHCIQSQPKRKRIIYADMDCPDIRLPEALPIMDQYGIAIYDLISDAVSLYGSSTRAASHGYIGIASDNKNVRAYFKTLKSASQDAAHRGHLGIGAFRSFLEALGMPNDTWHNVIGLRKLLPKMGKRPRHIEYTLPSADFMAWQSAHQSPASRGVAPAP